METDPPPSEAHLGRPEPLLSCRLSWRSFSKKSFSILFKFCLAYVQFALHQGTGCDGFPSVYIVLFNWLHCKPLLKYHSVPPAPAFSPQLPVLSAPLGGGD